MLTWRLWRALRFPDEGNPLFERIQAQSIDLPGKRLLRPLSPVFHALGFILHAVAIVIAPAALLIVSNVLGAFIAYNVMTTINREREQRTYDLLALTPMGLGRANWLIAVGCATRLNAIQRLASLRVLSLLTIGLLFTASLSRYTAVLSPLSLCLALLALNLDSIQSLIIGCLSGMLAQEFSEQGAPFAALAIFIFVQVIAVYLPITAVAILLIDLMAPRGIERWLVEAIACGVGLVLLLVLREALIRLMWRQLEHRLL